MNFFVLYWRCTVEDIRVHLVHILRVGACVQLHCCPSRLHTFKINIEPGSETVESSRPVYPELKVTVHFLENETTFIHSENSTCSGFISLKNKT